MTTIPHDPSELLTSWPGPGVRVQLLGDMYVGFGVPRFAYGVTRVRGINNEIYFDNGVYLVFTGFLLEDGLRLAPVEHPATPAPPPAASSDHSPIFLDLPVGTPVIIREGGAMAVWSLPADKPKALSAMARSLASAPQAEALAALREYAPGFVKAIEEDFLARELASPAPGEPA